MKILLIHPPSANPLLDQVYMHEPLGLEYLAAGLLADGHQVKIHDARIEPHVLEAARDFKPQLVGLTAYTSHVTGVIQLSRQLKTLSPCPLVVVGGHHATVQCADFNQPGIDLIVIGEGVETLRQIATIMQQGGDFTTIDGLAQVRPGLALHKTPPRPHPPLDSLPQPARHLTRPYRHHYFSEWLHPLASIRTSLGCTSRCSFCALWPLTGGRYLPRSVDSVVAELQTVQETNIFFCDDESMCDVERMSELAAAIATAGIKKNYFLYARADTVVNHPQLFRQWQRIGLVQVFIGMESFSARRLQQMKKAITLQQQQQAVDLLHNLGVIAYANFIVDPDFSRRDFTELSRHIRQLGLKHVGFSVLTPLPGTRLYQQRRHELTTDNPEKFDMVHAVLPTRLPTREFYQRLLDLYTKALPLSATLRTLRRYGLCRLPRQLRLLSRFSHYLKQAHLDS